MKFSDIILLHQIAYSIKRGYCEGFSASDMIDDFKDDDVNIIIELIEEHWRQDGRKP